MAGIEVARQAEHHLEGRGAKQGRGVDGGAELCSAQEICGRLIIRRRLGQALGAGRAKQREAGGDRGLPLGRERHRNLRLGCRAEADDALRCAMAQIVQQAHRLGVVAQAGQQQDVADPADLLGGRRHGAHTGQHLGFPRQHRAMGMVDDSANGAGQLQGGANAGGIGRQSGDHGQGCRGQKPGRGSDCLTARDRLTVHIRFGHSKA